ncbi:formin-like protein 18 [Vulpes lagopus]|uniref:formin-like protein 18 n=1 Tax=Vulpes lagopus TaxID=494514 RepID=UPI001BCA3620|nr:formin-like protein 18 [Vulpes lagopus]XP_041607529.1 formin-like protein 18 [Vulpes lagopus]
MGVFQAASRSLRFPALFIHSHVHWTPPYASARVRGRSRGGARSPGRTRPARPAPPAPPPPPAHERAAWADPPEPRGWAPSAAELRGLRLLLPGRGMRSGRGLCKGTPAPDVRPEVEAAPGPSPPDRSCAQPRGAPGAGSCPLAGPPRRARPRVTRVRWGQTLPRRPGAWHRRGGCSPPGTQSSQPTPGNPGARRCAAWAFNRKKGPSPGRPLLPATSPPPPRRPCPFNS